MSPVEWIWVALIALIVLLLPLVIVGLHRIWAASRNIEYYFRKMVRATRGTVISTATLDGLRDTIETGGALLSSGRDIQEHGKTIREVMTQRAGGQSATNQERTRDD